MDEPVRDHDGNQRWQRLTRRAFLRDVGLTASLAALAQLPAGSLGCAPQPEDASVSGLLSPDETEVLTQIVERMVDSDHPEAPAARETGAIAAIERLLGQLDPALTSDLPLALQLFEWGPIVFDLTLSRFTRMSPAEQDASIRCWMQSRLELRRQGYAALRNLAFIGYYSQDAAFPAIGYRGPLLARGSAG
ncbi:MAG: hypothetical protein QNK04_08610 [Myxococcota bacterium]|nr:hypothetical protein [Myxococcota bacterium]